VKSFSQRPTTTGEVVLAVGLARHLPPPGWQEKLDRALAIWHRACADETAAGMRRADIAHRLLVSLLAQRPDRRDRDQ